MTDTEIAEQFPIAADHVAPGYRISELQVCTCSAAGPYIGRMGWCPEFGGFEEPYCRESDYYRTIADAENDLKSFQVRDCQENSAMYTGSW